MDGWTGEALTLVDSDEQRNALKSLLDQIYDFNGFEAYSVEEAALGRVKESEFLALPAGATIPLVEDVDVGAAGCRINSRTFAEIYALNKARAPKSADPIKYGLLRAEAVKVGWVEDQREIVRIPAPADAIATMLADSEAITKHVADARLAAFLVPFAAEVVFRTTGHHFLSGLAATYIDKYKRLLGACLVGEIAEFLPPDVLYHHALHWVSPGKVWRVLQQQIAHDRIPEAIKLRSSAAPAGTAIITTTHAVILALEGGGFGPEVDAAYARQVEAVKAGTRIISEDPIKWHKVTAAYGVRAMTSDEKAWLEGVKVSAVQLAPLCQGFIEALFQKAALGQAKALKKHAMENPMLTQKFTRFFRAQNKRGVGSLKEIVTASNVRVGDAAAADADEE